MQAAGNGSRGRAGGVFGCSGPSHVRCLPVRAVPLAAVIPSRVPGREPGTAWGGSASGGGGSGGVNQDGARAGPG